MRHFSTTLMTSSENTLGWTPKVWSLKDWPPVGQKVNIGYKKPYPYGTLYLVCEKYGPDLPASMSGTVYSSFTEIWDNLFRIGIPARSLDGHAFTFRSDPVDWHIILNEPSMVTRQGLEVVIETIRMPLRFKRNPRPILLAKLLSVFDPLGARFVTVATMQINIR